MKYKLVLLLLLIWATCPTLAQDKTQDEKSKSPQASVTAPDSTEGIKPLGAEPDVAPGHAPPSAKVRGTPLDLMDKTKPRSAQGSADAISDRAPARPKADRRLIITDKRNRKIELRDFHLGSSGIWEYDGLRVRKPPEPPPGPKKPALKGKARIKDMQKRLHERLAKKRVNKNGPDPRRLPLTRDGVVPWDEMQEVNISLNKKDHKTYAQIITVDNKVIEGAVNVPSDYIIGSTRSGRDFAIRLRNIKHIGFTTPSPASTRKRAVGAAKPQLGGIKRGDKEPKKLQSKASTNG